MTTGRGEPWSQLCLDQCSHPRTSAYQVILIVINIIIIANPHDHDNHDHHHHQPHHHALLQAARLLQQSVFHLGQLGGRSRVSAATPSKEQLWLGEGKRLAIQ